MAHLVPDLLVLMQATAKSMLLNLLISNTLLQFQFTRKQKIHD